MSSSPHARRRRRSSELLVIDDDAITEVLLRLPPEEPAHLARASVVCRQWRRVLSDPAFRRLYAGFHRTPPLLGFFFNASIVSNAGRRRTPCFVPTTASPFSSSSSSAAAAADDTCPWLVLDCRHGRVLLQRRRRAQPPEDAAAEEALGCSCLVWDAVTGDRHELRWPNNVPRRSAVVLCAAAGAGTCDHSDCRGGGRPFLVLCAGVAVHAAGWRAYAYVYSSQLRSWGAPVHLDLLHGYQHVEQSRAAIIGDEVYLFRFLLGDQILRYDLRRQCLSLIDSPELPGMDVDVELMTTTEDGLHLGLASARGSRLRLWSRSRTADDDDAGWELYRVIDLGTMISSSPADNDNDNDSVIKQANVIGFAEGVNAILVGTNAGTFVIDLKSGRATKVCEDWILHPVVPFMAFCSPAWYAGMWFTGV